MMMGVKEVKEPPPSPVSARLIKSLPISVPSNHLLSCASAQLETKSSLRAAPPTHICIFLDAPETAENTPIQMTAAYTNGFRPTISDSRPLMGVMIVCDSM